MRNKKILPLTEEEKAYLAGIIDGEGSITISVSTDLSMTRKKVFRPMITITNTYLDLVSWILEKTGLGKIAIVKKNKKFLHHKQAYRWTAWSQQANQIIENIYPYLIVKKKQADIFFQMFRKKSEKRKNRKLSNDEWQNYIVLTEQIRVLNKKGE